MKAHSSHTGYVKSSYSKCKYNQSPLKKKNQTKPPKATFLGILLVNLQYTDFNGTTRVLQLSICFSVLLNWTARLHPRCVHSSHHRQELDQKFRDKLQLIILISCSVLDSFSSSAKLLLKITREISTIKARGGRGRHFASLWLDSVLPNYSCVGGKPSAHDYYILRISH